MNVVIVGARERAETEEDRKIAEELIVSLVRQHSSRLKVLSVGCDKGIGKIVRDYCMENGITFVEVRMKFEGDDIPKHFFAHMFLARNAALLDVGDEYYVFKGPNENGIVENIIPLALAKVGESRVTLYDYKEEGT